MCTSPALTRLLFLAALIMCSIGDGSPELAETLRWQLMRDNYDYSSEESEESPQLKRQEARVMQDLSLQPVTPPTLQPFINEVYVPRAASLPPDVLNDTAVSSSGQALNKNELLYYVDDGHLSRRAGDLPTPETDKGTTSQPDEDKSQEEDENRQSARVGDLPSQEDTTPKVKYKVLKVKEAGARGGRRSGGGRYRRFLQEERSDGGGVAIINLGDEPFPEFRLPQYSRHSPHAPDFEIALPSDLDEPITRPV